MNALRWIRNNLSPLGLWCWPIALDAYYRARNEPVDPYHWCEDRWEDDGGSWT